MALHGLGVPAREGVCTTPCIILPASLRGYCWESGRADGVTGRAECEGPTPRGNPEAGECPEAGGVTEDLNLLYAPNR